MQFSMITIAALASVASAAVNGTASAVWVTDVVTAYTTYCPASTTFSAYGQTYTVTEATTLTLACPCTSSYSTYITPIASVSTVPVPYTNATVATSKPVVATTPVGTGAAPTTAAPTSAFTGAANKAVAGSAGALAGVLGMALLL